MYPSKISPKVDGTGLGNGGRVEAVTAVGGGVRPRFATIDEVIMTRCTLGVLSAEESRADDIFTVGVKICVVGS